MKTFAIELPKVEILGPRLAPEVAMWRLKATSPEVDDKDLPRAYTVRVVEVGEKTQAVVEGVSGSAIDVRVPRLLAVDLTGDEDKTFELCLEPGSNPGTVKQEVDFAGDRGVKALVQPVLPKRDDTFVWPVTKSDPPVLPVLSPAAGNAVRIRLPAGEVRKALNALNLEDDSVDLTHDGLRFRASVTIPGFTTMKGAFLLGLGSFQTGPGTTERPFTLTLLPNACQEDEQKAWLAWWNGFQSGITRARSRRLSIGRDSESGMPALAWVVRRDKKLLTVQPGTFYVPGRQLRVRLSGTQKDRAPDGVVEILSEMIKLEVSTTTIRLEAWRDAARPLANGMNALHYAATPASESFTFESAMDQQLHPTYLDHEPALLARTLREAYALPDPTEGREATPRTIPAFVAVEEGWLQVPVENLPLPKPSDIRVATSESNAISGYLRLSGIPTQTFSSGYPVDPTTAVDPASPWSITVERAVECTAEVTLSNTFVLQEASVALVKPRLSCRGLIWFSVDCPDAIEAIPRLGAGPGSFRDVLVETTSVRPVGDLLFHLQQLQIAVGEAADSLLRQEVAIESVPTKDRPSLRLWARHGRLPLVASMPMTRSAASATRPLESREFAPFELRPSKNLLALQRTDGALTKVVRPFDLTPANDWPWPGAPGQSAAQQEGIAFGAMGAPGVEVLPEPAHEVNIGESPWGNLQFAYRYDVPVLDEAFATAQLPPVSGAAEQIPEPDPAATAIVPKSLEHHWRRQRDRQQLTRVEGTYAFGFLPKASQVDVTGLVEPFPWKADVAFVDAGAGTLPYGEVRIGDWRKSGNAALPGLDGDFIIDEAARELRRAKKGDITVTGWSAGSFTRGGLVTDGRGVSVGPASTIGNLQSRAVRVQDDPQSATERQLVTASKSIPVRWSNNETFANLWFKDLPIANKAFAPLAGQLTGSGFDAWTRRVLPFSGFEWRFHKDDGALDALSLDFFGFQFFPLRLESVSWSTEPAQQVPTELRVIGRLALTSNEDSLADSGNLLRLTCARVKDGIDEHLTVTQVDRVAIDKGGITPSNAPLVFPIAIRENQHSVPMVESAATLTVSRVSLAKDAAKLVLDSSELIFGFCRESHRVELEPAEVKFGQAITWPRVTDNSPHPQQVSRGEGYCAITSLLLVVDPAQTEHEIELALKFGIQPKDGDFWHVEVDSEGQLDWLGAKAGLSQSDIVLDEANRAISVSFNKAKANGAPIAGVSGNSGAVSHSGTVSGVVALTLGALVSGKLPRFAAVSAMAEVQYQADTQSNCFSAIDWRVSSAKAAPMEDWRQSSRALAEYEALLRVSGVFQRDSAIAWPLLKLAPVTSNKATVPVTIPATPAETAQHHVEVLLSRHEIPSGCLGVRPNSEPRVVHFARPWRIVALVKHRLTSDAALQASWPSIDTLVLSDLRKLVEQAAGYPVTDDPKELPGTTKELADVVIRHSFEHAMTHPLMVHPGVMYSPYPLNGTHGARFYAALKGACPDASKITDTICIAGAFTGFVNPETKPSFLRLPYVLTPFKDSPEPLGPSALQQRADVDTNVEVAWPDTHAAAEVVAALPALTGLSRFAEPDLTAALRDEDGAFDRSLPVDQFFIRGKQPLNPNLATEAFFLGPLIGLSRVRSALGKVTTAASLVSATVALKQPDTVRVLQVSNSAVATAGMNKAIEIDAMLMIGGSGLVERPWFDDGGTSDIESLDALMRGFVTRSGRDYVRQPAFAVLRRPQANPMFLVVTRLEAPTARDLVRVSRTFTATSDTLYADGHLGWPLGPADDAAPWRRPVDVGATTPYRAPSRVSDPPAALSSGLSGVSQLMSLPGWATALQEGVAPTDRVVWFSEKRVPPYLTADTPGTSGSGFHAPAIQWLTPFSARTRIPAEDSVRKAHERVSEPRQNGTILPGQAFVPPVLESLSVGDRAGVWSARIATLIGNATTAVPALDKAHLRFGRPGESSPAIVRHIRTPRPGPLPVNRGERELDRSVCPSPNTFARNSRMIRGPIDVLRDDGDGDVAEGFQPWEVVVGLGGEHPGVVTDRWDGSLKLVFELRILTARPITRQAAHTFLWRHLFSPEGAGNDVTTADVAATLIIGARRLPYGSLVLKPQVDPKRLAFVHRIVAVLDRRAPGFTGRPGAVDAEIVAAMAEAGTVPDAAVAFTVVTKRGVTGAFTPKAYALRKAEESALPSGPIRPPVTLRLPLSVVPVQGGALPLMPASVLFTDPAYDYMLGAPAHGQPEPVLRPPGPRGQVLVSLRADRGTYHLTGSIAFMFDVAYERPDPTGADTGLDGDIVSTNPPNADLALKIEVQPRDGGADLRAGLQWEPGKPEPKAITVRLARTYELPLGSIVGPDGKSWAFVAGDRVKLTVEPPEDFKVTLRKASSGDDETFGVTARKVIVTLTERPVVEPPPSLYSVLYLTGQGAGQQLSVPLHAQSPLPERTAFGDLKRDFRRGYIRRSAAFPWLLVRPAAELSASGAFVVKVDRNGQLLLAETDSFATLERLLRPGDEES